VVGRKQRSCEEFMCKGLPDRKREKSQGRLNHLQQQVADGNVLSRIDLFSKHYHLWTPVTISWPCYFAEFPPATGIYLII